MTKPVVDREICMGSGQCVMYAPNSFDVGSDLKARVTNPEGDSPETLRSAVLACPTGALSLDSDERQEQE